MHVHQHMRDLASFVAWTRDKLAPILPKKECAELLTRVRELDPPSGPPLFPEDLNMEDILKLFKLEPEGVDEWVLPDGELRPIPISLETILEGFDTGIHDEAWAKCRVILVLMSCIRNEQLRQALDVPSQNSSISTDLLHNLAHVTLEEPPVGVFNTSMSVPIRLALADGMLHPLIYKFEKRSLITTADYALWYGDEEDAATSLVVTLSKRGQKAWEAQIRCLAYIATIHSKNMQARKKNSTVHGIATDGSKFYFLRINDFSEFAVSEKFVWDSSDKAEIVSHICLILREAMDSTPTTTPTASPSPSPASQRKDLSSGFQLREN
ncbi:hypothetical protein AJ80_02054 [Polytolypa hystricis UAMH7299]|uniref:Uncharacterized protein n=1 Tax=Polytolypa hystricis (strain UAMH7299) TaxID=1447883 RepID=A0A2B7YQ55_POLH7|nr:hypothetical protein AJ80_02054 [Polytolypa hystricis UAMH7299]